ncbi:sensor histidine kinase [Amycolatopsis anabasis]|uniref:sensor histidine kinase n=1 Tax=Amycolatopsis anabasis TaxID=1840409 RepID=UPI00131DD367|nr:histidine kinase [Amycolatopsis anabasis]
MKAFRWLLRPATALDFVVLLIALAVALLTWRSLAAAGYDVVLVQALYAVVFAAPLLLIVRWPLAAWVLALAGWCLTVLAHPWGPSDGLPWPLPQRVLLLLTVVLVAARTRPRTAWLVWTSSVMIVVGLLFAFVPSVTSEVPPFLGYVFWSMLLVLTAVLARSRTRAQRDLAKREQRAEVEAARLAVLEERARIAREMHDVVAHRMSMIAVTAETAPYRLAELPDDNRAVLAGIAADARAALAEMRVLLGALRGDGEQPALVPQPGWAELDELVNRARARGIEVRHLRTGKTTPPEMIGLATYRILQEALSNAVRHASGRPVDVEVAADPDVVRLRVFNAAEPGRPVGRGHGVLGMRERAAAVGGSCTAGRSAGGWLVEAELPVSGGDT